MFDLVLPVWQVTLARSARGYGFSVNGHNPVYVTQVEDGMYYNYTQNRAIPTQRHYWLLRACPGLPAQQADIQVGDVIAEVEGTDVTRASGELIVSIVK